MTSPLYRSRNSVPHPQLQECVRGNSYHFAAVGWNMRAASCGHFRVKPSNYSSVTSGREREESITERNMSKRAPGIYTLDAHALAKLSRACIGDALKCNISPLSLLMLRTSYLTRKHRQPASNNFEI